MPTQPVSLLLIDDDDVEAELVSRSLQNARIANRIFRARDGEEGLNLLREDGENAIPKPVLVLLDLNMPRMDGIEFLDEIRGDEQLKRTTVFVLTTSNDQRDREQAYDRAVAGYIVKSNAGPEFSRLVELLKHFWRVVELPVGNH